MFSHCVPFPAPGPPNTNITLYLAILYICLETHWMWCSVFVTHRKELLNENCRKPILKSYFRNLQLRQIKYITLMDFCTDHWSKVISNFKSYWILKIYNNSKQIGFFFIVQWTQNIHFNSFLVWLFEMSHIQFDSCIKYKQYPPLYWILNSRVIWTLFIEQNKWRGWGTILTVTIDLSIRTEFPGMNYEDPIILSQDESLRR